MSEVKGAAQLLAEGELLIRELAAPNGTVKIGLPARVVQWQLEYARWRDWADSPAINVVADPLREAPRR